jgi:hypothetical protein
MENLGLMQNGEMIDCGRYDDLIQRNLLFERMAAQA